MKLLTPEILEIIFVVVGFLITYFKVKDRVAGKKYEKALMIVKDSIAETYQDFVRDLKAASEDGKLTEEEKKKAMEMTIVRIKEKSIPLGIDIAKSLGSAYLPGIIETILNKIKKGE